jgi:hypothetical protein
MPLPTASQYAALIDAAGADGYAIPAVNVTSTLTLNAALRGFAEARSPGIVQVTVGGAGYVSGAAADALVGARAIAAAGHELIARCPVPVALHTDHCPPDRVEDFLVPLIAASQERAARGEPPLFNSSTAAADRTPPTSARAWATAWSSSTSTPRRSTPSRGRSPTTCSPTTTACCASTGASATRVPTIRAPGARVPSGYGGGGRRDVRGHRLGGPRVK